MICKRRYGMQVRGLVATASLVTLASAAPAQDPLTEPPATEGQPARYTVEIIVFAYEDTSSAGNEVFTPPVPLDGMPDAPFPESLPGAGPEEAPVYDDRTPLARQTEVAPPSGPLEELPARARIELERLEPEAYRLQETWRKLEQLDAYRPILHAAWTQTTHEKAVSPTLPLRTVSDPPLGLDGSINLYQSRFLHLDIDLTLDGSDYAGGDARRSATDRLVRGEQANPPEEGEFGSDEPGGMQLPPLRYRITEDRIMRDGELRYFDHPRFGMLATVRRAEDDTGNEDAGDAL